MCIYSGDASFTIVSGMPTAGTAISRESNDVSVEDIVHDDCDVDEDAPDDTGSPTYEVLEGGTKRGRPKLVSSDGFSYSIKRRLIYVKFLCYRLTY